jgi:hypothetical protein
MVMITMMIMGHDCEPGQVLRDPLEEREAKERILRG